MFEQRLEKNTSTLGISAMVTSFETYVIISTCNMSEVQANE